MCSLPVCSTGTYRMRATCYLPGVARRHSSVLIPQELSVTQTSAGIKAKIILILVENKSRTGNLHLGKKKVFERCCHDFISGGLCEMIRSLKERQMLSGPSRYYYTTTMLGSTTGKKISAKGNQIPPKNVFSPPSTTHST